MGPSNVQGCVAAPVDSATAPAAAEDPGVAPSGGAGQGDGCQATKPTEVDVQLQELQKVNAALQRLNTTDIQAQMSRVYSRKDLIILVNINPSIYVYHHLLQP